METAGSLLGGGWYIVVCSGKVACFPAVEIQLLHSYEVRTHTIHSRPEGRGRIIHSQATAQVTLLYKEQPMQAAAHLAADGAPQGKGEGLIKKKKKKLTKQASPPALLGPCNSASGRGDGLGWPAKTIILSRFSWQKVWGSPLFSCAAAGCGSGHSLACDV